MLLRKLNYRNIVLGCDDSSEVVGVLKRDSQFVYVRWLGFIERSDALRMFGAIPVKIEVVAYSQCDDIPAVWVDLNQKKGELIQGCYTGAGVCAVTERGIPRIVTRTGSSLEDH